MRAALNVPLMLFSLFISLTLWLVVFAKDLPAPEGLHLNIEYLGLDDNHYFIDKNSGINKTNAYVKFRASADELNDIKSNPPTLQVDMSQAKEGSSYYPANLSNTRYDKELYDQTGMAIRVVVEKVIRKDVPVEVSTRGAWTDPTTALDRFMVSPRVSTVIGPPSKVDRVSHLVALFDLGGVSESDLKAAKVPLRAYDDRNVAYDVSIEPSTVSVTPVITRTPTDKLVLVSPSIVGQPAPGYLPRNYEIVPNTVTLTGDPAILASTTVVSSETVDVNGLTRDRSFRVRLRIPVNLKSSQDTVTIRYHVTRDPSYRPGSPTAPPIGSTTAPPPSGSRRGGT